ncbi:hypothetical protein [Sphingobacterium sp. LRF_L2]|uniref:hypothetical protein n=1 Tax=Sphingobacterium sp. LRF_L2 TaxID=3369421 RepID=UPI003F60CA86
MSLERGNKQLQIDELKKRLAALESGEDTAPISIADIEGLQEVLDDLTSRIEALEQA